MGALILADRRWCLVDRARPVGSSATKHLTCYGSDIRQRFSVSTIANKKKILVTGIFKIFSYFAAFVVRGPILVIGLFVCAARSVITTARITVRITENRDAIGIGNGSLTSRASGKPAAKAIGMIVGNQSVIYIEARRFSALVTATLNEHATAAPVVGGIGRIVSDVGFLAAHIKIANCRRRDTDTAALRVLRHVTGDGSTRELKRGKGQTPSASINTAASLSRIVTGNVTTVNCETATIESSDTTAAVTTVALVNILIALFYVIELAIVIGHVAIRDGHIRVLRTDARAITWPILERTVTGNRAASRTASRTDSHVDCRAVSVHTAAIESVVACDHATGQIKGRTFIFEFDACALARRGCTANVATAHIDGRAVLGIDQVTDLRVLSRGQHAALKVKRTARIDVDEPHRGVFGSHDGTIDDNLVLVDGLVCTSAVRSIHTGFSHVIGKLSRNVIYIGHFCRLAIIISYQFLVLTP